MKSFGVSFENSKHIPQLVLDSILANGWQSAEKLKADFLEKAKNKKFTAEKREVLVSALENQFINEKLSENQKKNLEALRNQNSFTVCCGHQLNFFSGPIFSFYKIIQIIKTCSELNKGQTDFWFVPLFWMATEDHDLQEVNHFYYNKKKIEWQTNQSGSVGRMSIENQKTVLQDFLENTLESPIAKSQINEFLQKIFQDVVSVSDLQRRFFNSLFSEKGLLILDPDEKSLKKQMVSLFQEEIETNFVFHQVNKTIKNWQKSDIQVKPREINLFYLQPNKRNRIVESTKDFFVLDDESKQWKKTELLQEIEEFPERFSPNVLMRILYQENILPNIAYIGGGAECKYWLEMVGVFDVLTMDYPIVIPRNSNFLLDGKWMKKWQKLGLSSEDVFLTELELENRVAKIHSNFSIDFDLYKAKIQILFTELEEKSKQTDSTLLGLVRAEKQRQMNGFIKMEKRLQKAERRVHKEKIDRMHKLRQTLYPNNQLQERFCNFSEFCRTDIESFVEDIEKATQTFGFDFNFVTLQSLK